MERFLCDHMCAQLGHWLRAAGYDTEIIEGPLSDPEVFQLAVQEERHLFTRDRAFLAMDPSGKRVTYLKGSTLEEWALQLKNELGIDWELSPFSRCLKCNVLLEPSEPTPDIPEKVRLRTNEFWRCPRCKQMFWQGTHTDRMLDQLKRWKSGS